MSKVSCKRDIWSLFQQITWWHRTAEWVLPWSRTGWGVCIAGLASRKQTASDISCWQVWRRKHLQVNSWTPGTRGCANLFKNNCYTTCNGSHHLINLTTISIHSQDPSVFCKGEIGESKGDVVGIATPPSFNFLMGALISATPPGMWYRFWFSIFLGRAHSQGSHLAFYTIISVTWKVKEQMWRCCQLLSISIPIMHPETEKITPGWVIGLPGLPGG